MSLFCCPICDAPLERTAGQYRCRGGHSYDIAREGYVHLLPANRKHAKEPGDDRAMVAARSRFLEGGWYSHLRQALCQLAVSRADPEAVFLDAGCGEGYYTVQMAKALRCVCPQSQAAGVDISKWAVAAACKRDSSVRYAVDSLNHIPMTDGSVDCLTNVFAPLVPQEFHRVLRPGGSFLLVIPGPEHLWELKTAVYDHPYPNHPEDTDLEGFVLEEQAALTGTVRLDCQDDIASLFAMTPYFWKTSPADAAKLESLSSLAVRYEFTLLHYRRL